MKLSGTNGKGDILAASPCQPQRALQPLQGVTALFASFCSLSRLCVV